MDVKKLVCCLSLRTGTLVLLYIHLIVNVWSVMNALSNIGDPVYKKYLSLDENATLFYMNLFLSVVGGLIFLSTIVSITNVRKTPSDTLLSTTIAFLILEVIYCVYDIVQMVQMSSNDSLKDLYDDLMKEEAQKLKLAEREKFLKYSDSIYGTVIMFLYVIIFSSIVFTLYSIVILYSYNNEVRKNIENDLSASCNNNTITDSSVTPPPATAPQCPPPPPEYPLNGFHLCNVQCC